MFDNFTPKQRNTATIFTTEATAALITPGVVYFAENCFGKNMDDAKKWVAGNVVKPYFNKSGNAEEIAHTADSLVKGSLGFITDLAATFGLQTLFKKMFRASLAPSHTAMIEVSTHLALTAFMSTIAKDMSEKVSGTIAKILQSCGLSEKNAQDAGMVTTYIVTPGIASASLASLFANHNLGK